MHRELAGFPQLQCSLPQRSRREKGEARGLTGPGQSKGHEEVRSPAPGRQQCPEKRAMKSTCVRGLPGGGGRV